MKPWESRFVEALLGRSFHPGGADATRSLLAAGSVRRGARVLDVACGAGEGLRLARAAGAAAVGVDVSRVLVARTCESGLDALCGRMERLPFRDATFDALLCECALCLATDPDPALEEFRRVLAPGGRLLLSDVTLESPIADPACLPGACLSGAGSRRVLEARVARAGFGVVAVEDHRGDVAELRARVRSAIDVDGLLAALGPWAETVAATVRDVEAAFASGDLGYASLVAVRAGSPTLRR